MKNRYVACGVFCFGLLAISGSSGATPPPPPDHTVFVSSFNGHQILRIDVTGGSPAVTALDIDPAEDVPEDFLPEDIVVGPDGKIYICDAPNDRIFRMNQDGSEFEPVYEQSGTTPPSGPEGPSFLGPDLYFNTRGDGTPGHTGIWRIPGVAAVPHEGTMPAPGQVVEPLDTFGEGTAFGLNGELLMVSRDTSEVWVANPPFVSGLSFTDAALAIEGFARPFGVAADPKGDIYVADFDVSNIYRCSKADVLDAVADDMPLDIAMADCSVFVDFGDIDDIDTACVFNDGYSNFYGTDSPTFMEFDMAGNLFVVTSCSASPSADGGKVWLLDSDGDVELLADLDEFFDEEVIGSNKAVGLALPATSTSDQNTYTGGDIQTEPFDCGSTTVRLTMNANCDAKITCTEVQPNLTNDDFEVGDPPKSAECIPPDWNGGYCIEYEFHCLNEDASPATTPVTLYFSYNTFEPPVNFPAIVKEFTENITNGYFSFGEVDPGKRGTTTGNSRFHSVDLELDEGAGEFAGFLSPIAYKKGQPNTFKVGSTIPIKFKIEDEFGNPVSDAKVFVTVAKKETGAEPIMDLPSTGGSSTEDIAEFNGNHYQFNLKLDSSVFDKNETYVVNLISEKMSGFAFIEFITK
jgi:hypothetical protein